MGLLKSEYKFEIIAITLPIELSEMFRHKLIESIDLNISLAPESDCIG